jgi:hypothetical protein
MNNTKLFCNVEQGGSAMPFFTSPKITSVINQALIYINPGQNLPVGQQAIEL